MTQTRRKLVHFGITVVLLALGAGALARLAASRTEIQKRPSAAPAPVVRTLRVQSGEAPIRIGGEGTVKPLREIRLVPQVGGEVAYVSPNLVNGGAFRRGELLLRIEPIDYELAVTLAEAKVKDAKRALELAQEESASAQEEWRLLHAGTPKGKKTPPPLVAKEPQLAAAKAALDARRAELEKALLDLERTELRAPFDGRISQEDVDRGQFVSPGQVLGSFYSTEAAEIILPMEDGDLLWFHVPGFTPGTGAGSPALVKARVAGRDRTWTGRAVRAEGKLDERTRMVNVVVRVERPYDQKPPLAVGLFVDVEITGRTLPEAVLIPRSALRQGHRVWVVDPNDRLRFREVDVARIEGETVILRSGLRDGERLVTSPLKAVTDGMTVRVMNTGEGGGP
jgi:RND family efflux transporter MFP subunit